jgi:hypothetical protein
MRRDAQVAIRREDGEGLDVERWTGIRGTDASLDGADEGSGGRIGGCLMLLPEGDESDGRWRGGGGVGEGFGKKRFGVGDWEEDGEESPVGGEGFGG